MVEVPASTANLGAGYDALAMALDFGNRVEVEATEGGGVHLAVHGEGADELASARSNRFIDALRHGLRLALHAPTNDIGWRIHMHNEIPLARGLGSSAAATVAGLLAANALTGTALDTDVLLGAAVEMEGHPDNAAAALLGGVVAVSAIGPRIEAVRLEPPRDLAIALCIPDLALATSEMRAVLPRDVPHGDATFNVGRVALGVASLAAGRVDLLGALTEDRLHEPYRARVFPALPRLIAAARAAGALGACLSGSGSTVLAFTQTAAEAERVAEAMATAAGDERLAVRTMTTRPRARGATVVEVR